MAFVMSLFVFALPDDANSQAGWDQGNVLAGANTSLDNTSVLNLRFSPVVGYAITENDLVTASVAFENDDQTDMTTQFYSVGYQRMLPTLLDGIYATVSYGYSSNDLEDNIVTPVDESRDVGSILSGGVGYFYRISPYWYVAPSFGVEWTEVSTAMTTNVTFGLVLNRQE